MIKYTLLVAVALVALGCGGSGGSSSPNPDFVVMVVRTTDTGFELRSRGSDGSEGALLGTVAFNLHATVSPDGSKLATVDQGQGSPLTVSNLDGSNPAQVGEPGEMAINPALSHDGSKVVFDTSVTDSPFTDLYVAIANSNGTGLLLLSEAEEMAKHAQFNSDGTRVIYISQRDGILTVQIVDVDGGNRETLYTPEGLAMAYPTLSPNDEKLAFISNSELWIVDLKSGTPEMLAEDVVVNRRPYFSPDGNWLLYTAMQTPGGGPITHPTKIRITGSDSLAMPVTESELVAGTVAVP